MESLGKEVPRPAGHEHSPRILNTRVGGERNLVQVELAKLAYPGDPHPLVRWAEEYAEQYSNYVEKPGCPTPQVDVNDPAAMRALLEAMRSEDATIH